MLVRQANPTSVAILSIQGSTNTSQALYPNVTTSNARCGSRRCHSRQLFASASTASGGIHMASP